MQFCYRSEGLGHNLPDPYERLIADTIRGDQTFFNDAAEVEAQWAFIDVLVKGHREGEALIDPLVNGDHPLHPYDPGSWGPKAADDLIEADGRKWLEPSMEFCRI